MGAHGFTWTQEDKERVARGAVMIDRVRYGDITGEEALLLTLNPPTHHGLDALVRERAKEMRFVDSATVPKERSVRAVRSANARKRWREDTEYRERRLAEMRAKRDNPEFRARERARSRARRAKAKERGA